MSWRWIATIALLTFGLQAIVAYRYYQTAEALVQKRIHQIEALSHE
jgi:hypothetical protein